MQAYMCINTTLYTYVFTTVLYFMDEDKILSDFIIKKNKERNLWSRGSAIVDHIVSKRLEKKNSLYSCKVALNNLET